MKSLLPRASLITLALGVCAAGYAQEPVPIEFYRPLKNSVSIGVRMFGGNAKVGFSNLGNIPSGVGSLGDEHYYNNGSVVGPDGQSSIETDTTSYSATYGGSLKSETIVKDSSDNPLTTTRTWVERRALPGGRRFQLINHIEYIDHQDGAKSYQAEAIGREYVAFDPAANAGQTRYWSFSQTNQVKTDSGGRYLELSEFTVNPSGGTAQAESDDSPGVELQFARIIKRYKRFEWGINFSAGAATINAKTSNVIRANLRTISDRYRIAPTDSFNNPVTAASLSNWYNSRNDLEDKTALPVVNPANPTGFTASEYSYVSENFKYINNTAFQTGVTSDTPVDVFGYWQVKGAYYLLRVGPVIRFPFAKKWTVTAGAGLAGAYAGTEFIADEYIIRDDLGAPLRIQERSEEKRFVGGYYADVNIERWLTVRTGFFLGYGFEKLGKYDQELYGRKADIDLGTSKGVRFGIITRF